MVAILERPKTDKASDPPYRVPGKGEFGGAEFLPADDLRQLAREIVDKHPDKFGFLSPYEVCFLWRAKGGASGGIATLGKTTKASGLVRYFGEQDIVVWLAADHCRDLALSRHQVEALLFHELSPRSWTKTGSSASGATSSAASCPNWRNTARGWPTGS
jgi:hypothetical protein